MADQARRDVTNAIINASPGQVNLMVSVASSSRVKREQNKRAKDEPEKAEKAERERVEREKEAVRPTSNPPDFFILILMFANCSRAADAPKY